MAVDFTWKDGERLIRFGPGALEDAPALLAATGFHGYALVPTERALAAAPELAAAAGETLTVPAGRVADAAGALRDAVGESPLVALGGGRVVDTAKSLAAVGRVACAAVPTTLSGAELSPRHRLPPGTEGVGHIRPSLVIADPVLMASQPMPQLAASAMNALGHALEALYVPSANPVAELAALRATTLIAHALAPAEPLREELALGALLAGYALGATGLAVHHVVCQTIVATCATAHGQTNAAMLPHSTRLMVERAPEKVGRFAEALGSGTEDPTTAAELVTPLAARSGVRTLSQLGVVADALPEVARTSAARPELAHTPSPPAEAQLLAMLRAAL